MSFSVNSMSCGGLCPACALSSNCMHSMGPSWRWTLYLVKSVTSALTAKGVREWFAATDSNWKRRTLNFCWNPLKRNCILDPYLTSEDTGGTECEIQTRTPEMAENLVESQKLLSRISIIS